MTSNRNPQTGANEVVKKTVASYVQQLFPSLCPAVVKAVSCVPSPLRVLSHSPNFNARHLAPIWPVNKTDVWYRLSPGVRARLKAVSADGLRIPIRTKPGAYGRTRDTRKGSADLLALFWCSTMVAHLDAFFGAPQCSQIRFAYPFRPKPGNLATPLHGPLNTKFTGKVYMA